MTIGKGKKEEKKEKKSEKENKPKEAAVTKPKKEEKAEEGGDDDDEPKEKERPDPFRNLPARFTPCIDVPIDLSWRALTEDSIGSIYCTYCACPCALCLVIVHYKVKYERCVLEAPSS